MFKRIISAGLVFGAAALAPPATAATCFQRENVVQTLQTLFSERQTALGLQANGKLVEVWTSAESGNFTILVTSPDGISCVVSSGGFWQSVVPVQPEDGTAS